MSEFNEDDMYEERIGYEEEEVEEEPGDKIGKRKEVKEEE